MDELLVYVFQEAGEEDILAAREHFGLVDVDFGTEIIADGATDQALFIIIDGEVDIRKGKLELTTARSGALFGELGLFGHTPRTATVKAASPVSLLYIHREGFLELQRTDNLVAWVIECRALATVVARLRDTQMRIQALAKGTSVEMDVPQPGLMEWVQQSFGMWGRKVGGHKARADLLRSLPHFRSAAPEAIDQLAQMMDARRFKAGQFICRAGDDADEMYVIAEGQVDVLLSTREDRGDRVATLSPGNFFGVSSMLDNTHTRNASCRAASDVTLLTLSRGAWQGYADTPGKASSSLRSAMIATLSEQLAQATAHLQALHSSNLSELHDEFATPVAAPDRNSVHDQIFKR